MKTFLLVILSLCCTSLWAQPPRMLSVYTHAGTIDSLPVSDFDSLAFPGATNLSIYLKAGGVTTVPLDQIDSIGFPFVGGPVCTVLSPNGGQTFHRGDSLALSWHINPVAMLAQKVAVFLSPNDTNWDQIDLSTTAGGEPQVFNNDPRYDAGRTITCKWKISDPISPWTQPPNSPVSTRCRIKVAAYGFSSDPEQYDISDAAFTIQP